MIIQRGRSLAPLGWSRRCCSCIIFMTLLLHSGYADKSHRSHPSNSNNNGHRHRQRHGTKAPYISVDAYGNCYAVEQHLRGRCTPFQNCPSAVRDWREMGALQTPSCYYTTYENFVCCPDAHHQELYSNSNTEDTDTEVENNEREEEVRISEKKCAKLYSGTRKRIKRRQRSRREVTTDLAATDNGSNSDELSHDPQILKEVQSENGVVGGVRAELGEFPFMCALGWKPSRVFRSVNADNSDSDTASEYIYNCGCALIARKFVLTAAHCASIGGESPAVVRLGGDDLNAHHAEVIKIRKITQHPDYDAQLVYHDIALIKLRESSSEAPACLWSRTALPQSQVIALGYGQIAFAGPPSNTLNKVHLNVVNNDECSRYYPANGPVPAGIVSTQICAGDAQRKRDTCQGDSGGPLLFNLTKHDVRIPFIVGVTSFGVGCASGTPSVYTRLSSYIDWIEDVIWG